MVHNPLADHFTPSDQMGLEIPSGTATLASHEHPPFTRAFDPQPPSYWLYRGLARLVSCRLSCPGVRQAAWHLPIERVSILAIDMHDSLTCSSRPLVCGVIADCAASFARSALARRTRSVKALASSRVIGIAGFCRSFCSCSCSASVSEGSGTHRVRVSSNLRFLAARPSFRC